MPHSAGLPWAWCRPGSPCVPGCPVWNEPLPGPLHQHPLHSRSPGTQVPVSICTSGLSETDSGGAAGPSARSATHASSSSVLEGTSSATAVHPRRNPGPGERHGPPHAREVSVPGDLSARGTGGAEGVTPRAVTQTAVRSRSHYTPPLSCQGAGLLASGGLQHRRDKGMEEPHLLFTDST